MARPKIVILSGAGISAESGLKTFRNSDGLWEGHNVMEVATPQGWKTNQELVLQFYNERRKQLLEVQPNEAHKALVQLENKYDVHIITQNVDDLHERAGSSQVMHLHGELLKVRSTTDMTLIYEWNVDLKTGDLCEKGAQLRPHIVWFGEDVPLLEKAATIVSQADYLIIVGTSMQVYPAASLVNYTRNDTHIYFVDPNPSISASDQLTIYAENATSGLKKITEQLLRVQ